MTPSLFVYGSLRQGFNNAAYSYISKYFNYVGTAVGAGLLYNLGPYPAAVPANNFNLIGELYTIKNPNEFNYAIAQLDDYEGVFAEEDEIAWYRRDLTTVKINNTEIEAWVYWYNGPVEGKPIIESGDVLEYLNSKL